MPQRQLISSGAPWETQVGYSRAVRVGSLIEVAGTTAVDEAGEIVGPGDLYAQTYFVIQKIEKALHAAGATLADVVRTRMYVTDISRWEEAGRAHGAFFHEIRPASTLLAVAALVDPRLLVEIEVTAVAGE
ncbi:MAG: RidA family protein [Bacteroidia bacterium]|nr:RidA family protein [Bacteroidia bacterium]